MKNVCNYTCYDYLQFMTKGKQDEQAIVYENVIYSFRELIFAIDSFADILKKANIRENEICTIVLPDCPQLAIAFYALNKIGAIANIFFYDISGDNLTENMKLTNSKVLISTKDVICLFSNLYKKMDTIIETSSNYKDKCFPFYIIKNEMNVNCKRNPRLMTTSGTNSPIACIMSTKALIKEQKQIMLSNESLNFLVNSLSKTCRLSYENCNVFATLDLYTISGIVLCIHWTLTNGWTYVSNSSKSINVFTNTKLDGKKYALITHGNYLNTLANHQFSQITSIEWILNIIDEDKKYEEINNLKNEYEECFHTRVINALSRAELGSIYAVSHNNDAACFIPLDKTLIQTEEKQNVNFIHIGCSNNVSICSPSIMSGYFSDNPMEYNGIYRDKHGKKWIHLV